MSAVFRVHVLVSQLSNIATYWLLNVYVYDA